MKGGSGAVPLSTASSIVIQIYIGFELITYENRYPGGGAVHPASSDPTYFFLSIDLFPSLELESHFTCERIHRTAYHHSILGNPQKGTRYWYI